MKYSTQLINLANQNAQATRPKYVGSMNELFEKFRETQQPLENWKQFYLNEYGQEAIDCAAAKIKDKIQDMKVTFDWLVDNLDVVDGWVENLIFEKTIQGFEIQSKVLSMIAGNRDWRLSTKFEESLGIDGFIEDTPYQIKPHTAKHSATVNQQDISAIIVYYRVKGGKITVESDNLR